jgi:hypothetical protein
MGGKSKSSQKTSNKQQTQNIVNDGDFAGVSGSVAIDESEQSIQDAYNTSTDNSIVNENDNSVEYEDAFNTNTDNSIEYEDAFNTNTDNSIEYEDAFNTNTNTNTDNSLVNENDNSVEYEDAFNTDNSIINDNDNRIVNDGDFAGSYGDITVLDGGALEISENIAIRAIDNNALLSGEALAFGVGAIDSMSDLSGDAINAVGEHSLRTIQELSESSRFALGNMAGVSDVAISGVSDISALALDELNESTRVFSDNLSSASQSAMATNSQVLAQASASNTQDKEIIAQLAKSTSLAGQDIVAESSQKMTLYMSIAVTVIGIAFVFVSVKGGS